LVASERLERRILHVCDATGTLVEYWGFKSIMGRVWTLLALSNEPLAQTRIAEVLGVSRSLVSATITELGTYGLVRATEDHRNAPYEAVLDIWPAITDTLRSREWMLLESTRLALEAAIEEAELSPGPPGAYSTKKMRLLLAMIGTIQRLLGLVIAIRKPDTLQNVTGWVKSVTALIDTVRKLR